MVSDNLSQDINIRGKGNIVVGKGDVIINPLPPAETRLRHDLGILMKNVETTWIKGVLEKSVHEAALLELGMEIREEAVDNPWQIVMEKPDQSREEISKGRKVKDIFDEANRLLLILGEPGSGKTTTLLQLAHDLIAEVDEAFTQPVPVILNLSTWTNKQQPLEEWLVSELSNKYRVPKKDGKKWLQDRRILPLLDGLDEVKIENRVTCVEKINQLVDEYGLQGLVVCSRVKDYMDLNARLAFYRAIYLQPLTTEQVDTYLDKAGNKLSSLRTILQSDETLLEMAQSPLILNIMSLAYQDTPTELLSDSSLETKEARISHLFDIYIFRMFNRKRGENKYDTKQTKHRLSWLARNMQKLNQDVFLIENLQPIWLETHRWRFVYILGSRLISALSIFLCINLIGSQINRIFSESIIEIGSGVIDGVITGLIVSIIDILKFEWQDQKEVSKFILSVINIASVGLIVGLSTWLIYHLTLSNMPGDLQIVSLILTIIVGLIFGIKSAQRSLGKDIHTVEALHWSWREALKGIFIGILSGGLIVGTLVGMFAELRTFDAILIAFMYGLILGPLLLGPTGGLIGAVFYGLRPKIIETKITPNQGILLSYRNAIYGGFVGGMVGWIIGWLTGGSGLWYQLSISGRLSDGLIWGVIFGVVGVIWYGALDVIQHHVLRFILIIQDHTPRNYVSFLDYAVDRIFLQKVGGGYRFIHRLLLEHFAEMYKSERVS